MNKKNNNTTKIVISGANGRMGNSLIQSIQIKEDFTLVSAIVKKNSSSIGIDAGKLAGIGNINILCKDNINEISDDFDVIIDFSSTKNTINNISFCCKHNKMIVIGTTGFSDIEKKIIKNAASQIGIVFSPNFSIGINLLIKLVENTTKIIGKNSDIEIIELHHRDKIDSPSGTALAIGESISKIMKCNFHDNAVFSRHCSLDKRKKNEIGFSSIRAGNIVGEHNIMFINDYECINIKHQAFNRVAFSNGALCAAHWIKNHKKNGLYDMQDVLNLSFL